MISIVKRWIADPDPGATAIMGRTIRMLVIWIKFVLGGEIYLGIEYEKPSCEEAVGGSLSSSNRRGNCGAQWRDVTAHECSRGGVHGTSLAVPLRHFRLGVTLHNAPLNLFHRLGCSTFEG